MTEAEKAKLLKGFQKIEKADEEITDDWTKEEILAVAKKIMERMGINGKLQ